jgi:uncharacterized protein YcbK (DUF882 family)
VDKLVLALEALRQKVGPIIIDSAYRCGPHNKEVGGEPNSRHLQGMAADIRVPGMTPAEVYRVALTVPAFGGFGVAHNFVHLDVRITPAKWCYGPDGKQAPWDSALDQVVAG